jgi:hypothetical protein
MSEAVHDDNVVTQIYVAAPCGALTWRSSAERNRLLKLWRREVLATFGDSSRCIRLAWVLADSFNAKLGYAFPTNRWLARETLIAENKVQATLAALEQGGAVVRTWVAGSSGQKQRAIYPARALIPTPAVGVGGGPQQPGVHNLRRRPRLPKTQLEHARLLALARLERESAAGGTGGKGTSEEEFSPSSREPR